MATTPLFVPSTRYVDLLRQENPEGAPPDNFTEQEISVENAEALLAVSDDDEQAPVAPVAAIPSAAWQEFETALGRGVVWLGSVIFFGYNAGDRLVGDAIGYDFPLVVVMDGERIIHVYTPPSAREDVALGCSLLFRLLETRGVTRVRLSQIATTPDELPCTLPGPVLSRFLTNTTSLETFRATSCRFCEPHIRALSDASVRPELEVVLNYPHFTPSGKLALVTCMHRNQGPTEFLCTTLEARLLADAIPGNTRLKHLTLVGHGVDNHQYHDEIAALVQSLSEDKGIQELKFQYIPLRDEVWELLSGALPKHPKLHTLEFTCTGYNPTGILDGAGVSEVHLPEETKLFRAQHIVELLKTNTVLTSVNLRFDHALIATEIEPRLRINRYRPKLRAITRAPYAWRRQLLGRALDTVSQDPTLLYLVLTQNGDVVVTDEAPW